MYDRYKSKRKNTVVYKVLAILLVIAGMLFLGIKYHRYLTFWKYNENKLDKRIVEARQIQNIEKRRDALSDLSGHFERYKEEHPVDPDAFFLSGQVHYMLGESFLSGSFSDLFINDRVHTISKEAKLEFLKSIKDIKKGSALDTGSLDDANAFILAKAGYYADYYGSDDIFRIIENTGESIKLKDVENIRFYSIVNILNKHEDYGIKFLSDYGMVRDNIQGLLFYATAQRLAKKYTGAIVTFKDVLTRTTDERILKLVHVNLGKVYFNQSLFREALAQFNSALKIDEKDQTLKIWIGKNFAAMGDKDKAKAIWSEVLTIDGANVEAKKLLKSM